MACHNSIWTNWCSTRISMLRWTRNQSKIHHSYWTCRIIPCNFKHGWTKKFSVRNISIPLNYHSQTINSPFKCKWQSNNTLYTNTTHIVVFDCVYRIRPWIQGVCIYKYHASSFYSPKIHQSNRLCFIRRSDDSKDNWRLPSNTVHFEEIRSGSNSRLFCRRFVLTSNLINI